MGLFRRRAASPPTPPARKASWRVRTLKRLLIWLAPFALDTLRRRRAGGTGGKRGSRTR